MKIFDQFETMLKKREEKFKKYCQKKGILCKNISIGTMRVFKEASKHLCDAMLVFYPDKIKLVYKQKLKFSSRDILYNDVKQIIVMKDKHKYHSLIVLWQNYKFVVDIISYADDITEFFKDKCPYKNFDYSRIFIPESEHFVGGTCCYEFQYCKKNGSQEKMAKKGWGYWLTDSLLVSADFDDVFFDQYFKYLKTPYSPDGSNCFDEFGMNYYSKEMTQKIIEQLNEDKPKEYQTLVEWLQKATDQYNGFYFCGI